MMHIKYSIVAACIAIALAGVGCDSARAGQQPFAGATGGTAGVGGTGGVGGMTGGTAGVGGAGGLGGMTAGAAGFAGMGGIGGTAGVAGMTGGTAGAGGVAGVGGVGGVGGMVGQTDAIPCEVDMVVIQSCHACHGAMTAFGAPASLVTLADFQRDYVAVSTKQLKGQSFKMYELARIRLNREMGTSPMPQGPPLAADKMMALNTWLMNGAPGGAACASP